MSGLEFRIRDIEEDGVVLKTSALLTVYVDDFAIWPVHGDDEAALDIQIDDLLSHLAEFWKPLLLRQTYPLGLTPARPSDLSYQARRRWVDKPEDQVAAEDEEVERFTECHDLSRCFAGYFDLAALWMIRSGEYFIIEGPGSLKTVDFAAAQNSLTVIGDTIAERLAAVGQRWIDLIAAWRTRDSGESLTFLSWSTGLDRASARALAEEGLLESPQSLADAARDNDELRVAARMASALPLEQVRTVLELIQTFPRVEAPKLMALAEEAAVLFKAKLSECRPYEQGEGLADFVWEWLQIDRHHAADIFGLVEDLGIDVRIRDVEPETLDALAVSGRRHGPAILLNASAVFVKPGTQLCDTGRARVTMAHELCHLLVDAQHTLSAVDVLGGLMPHLVEQRARAFGAQFLLPSSIAAEVWQELGAPQTRDGVQDTLALLCDRYNVTHSVASWKLEHGARTLGTNLEPVLRSLVPHR